MSALAVTITMTMLSKIVNKIAFFMLRHKLFFIVAISLILVKVIWVAWSCGGNGPFDKERNDIHQRRNYLVDMVMVEPKRLMAIFETMNRRILTSKTLCIPTYPGEPDIKIFTPENWPLFHKIGIYSQENLPQVILFLGAGGNFGCFGSRVSLDFVGLDLIVEVFYIHLVESHAIYD